MLTLTPTIQDEIDAYASYNKEEILTVLAQEGIFSNVAALGGLFKKIVPDLKEAVQGFFKYKTYDGAKFDTKLFRNVVNASRNFDFSSYRDMLVVAPEGFGGLVIPYAIQLSGLVDHTSEVVTQEISTYRHSLSRLLNSQDDRNSNTFNLPQAKFLRAERDKIEKNLLSYFNPDRVGSRVKLSTIISRFADLSTYFQEAERLQKAFTQQKYDDIAKITQEAVEFAELFSSRLEDGTLSLSRPVVQSVAEATYQVASYIKLISMIGYYAETLLSSTVATAELLDKAFTVGVPTAHRQ